MGGTGIATAVSVIKSGGGGGWLDRGGATWIKSRGGGANWPKGVFLFLVQGEKWGGGQMILCPPPTFESGGRHGPCMWPHPLLRPCDLLYM